MDRVFSLDAPVCIRRIQSPNAVACFSGLEPLKRRNNFFGMFGAAGLRHRYDWLHPVDAIDGDGLPSDSTEWD